MMIWRFPKIGLPQIIYFKRIFHYKLSIFGLHTFVRAEKKTMGWFPRKVYSKRMSSLVFEPTINGSNHIKPSNPRNTHIHTCNDKLHTILYTLFARTLILSRTYNRQTSFGMCFFIQWVAINHFIWKRIWCSTEAWTTFLETHS